ncbi:hypothetical protein L3081_19170 [Colwellia sp. MSW7]|uniref:Uncharacterized protein n=1 Tax=Colwellia maritima TaxID=2912588 RepID=A0ABS9X4F3_9GAMM|nr:hypothetical protein [Colwellia maritima]MCI2285119.1 hypothetical protein [Colwellia maritima]
MASHFARIPNLLSADVQEVVEGFLSIESIFGQSFQKNSQLKAQLAESLSALRQGKSRINNIAHTLGSSYP